MEKIVQNIAIAYVNDFELLDDETSLIHHLLIRREHSELDHLIWFLWTLRKDRNEKTERKIFELWPRMIQTIDIKTREGRRLASKLCYWMVFVDKVNDTNKPLILAVIPYADDSSESLESIARISAHQPFEAYEIWRRMLGSARPTYPREAIRTTLGNLIAQGAAGVRKAKEIVSLYLEGGDEDPYTIFKEIRQTDQGD